MAAKQEKTKVKLLGVYRFYVDADGGARPYIGQDFIKLSGWKTSDMIKTIWDGKRVVLEKIEA